MLRKLTSFALLAIVALTIAACGTVATPEWEATIIAERDTTQVAIRETSAYETAIAPTVTPTSTTTPTPTLEPTAAPTEVPTLAPTVAATEAPTEAPTEVAAAPSFDVLVADAIAAGNPVNGQAIFNQSFTTASGPWVCASCHSVGEDQLRLIGPGLYGVAARAGEVRIAETGDPDPVTYVRNSILHPMDYIVPPDANGVPYPENLMPQNYSEVLTEDQLNDLVAYVLSLGNS